MNLFQLSATNLEPPLTSIQGSLGLLKEKLKNKIDEKSKRLVELSYNSCERLTSLVNDILDMEKISAGKLIYHNEITEINKLIKNIIEQNQSFAKNMMFP